VISEKYINTPKVNLSVEMECAYHPNREAVSKCSVCGKPLCKECGELCEECAARKKLAEEGRVKLINWEGWVGSFITPAKTFRMNLMNSSLTGVSMNLLIGLINAGVIAALLVIGENVFFAKAVSLAQIFGYTTPFLAFLAVWFVITLIAYSFAMLAGGVGNVKQHFYTLSLPIPFSPVILWAAWGFLMFLFSLHLSAGLLGSLITAAYIVRIQTAAVGEAHKLGGIQAVITGTVPIVICGIMVVLISVVLRK